MKYREFTKAEWQRIVARGKRQAKAENRAVSLAYDRKRELLVIGLRNGVFVSIPRSHMKALKNATPVQIENMQLIGWGSELFWPDLDDGLDLMWFIEHVVGFKTSYATGREGGVARSRAKATAARSNGVKGGRPRKKAA